MRELDKKMRELKKKEEKVVVGGAKSTEPGNGNWLRWPRPIIETAN